VLVVLEKKFGITGKRSKYIPSRLSPDESPGSPYQNSTGESRQGFTRDLQGSEGESLGNSKGVNGSPWGT